MPLQQRQAQSKRRRRRPASTPMTIPAIAPPLSPVLLGEAETGERALPSVLTGVWNGSVVVAVPVDVTVTTVAVVGRMNAEFEAVGGMYVPAPAVVN